MSSSSSAPSPWRGRHSAGLATDVLINLLVAGVYWALTALTFLPTTASGRVTPMFPPAGLALAAVWLGGYRLLPGVLAGCLLVTSDAGPLTMMTLICGGNLLALVVQTELLRRLGFDARLERVRDPLLLGCVAAPIGAVISATTGLAGVYSGGALPSTAVPYGWLLWFMREWLGVLVAGSLIVAWYCATPIVWTRARIAEGIALLVALAASSQFMFGIWAILPGQNVPLVFLFFPLVGWAGLRFGPRGASTVVALVAAYSLPIVASGLGPFAQSDIAVTHLLLFLFLALGSLSGLLLAALMAERDAALERQLAIETELRHSQKMEAVGRLAGGIAHDFSNILTAIIGYNEVVLAQLEPDDPRRADAEEIGRAAMRAAALTQQMLAFSRRQVIAPRVVDLNGIVSGVEPMLRRLLRADIDMRVTPHATRSLVRVDPGQIDQVIMNLVVNAHDAMPHGGRLSVETSDDALDADRARAHDARPGPYVRLTVTDTGTGMSPDVRARIFEPYFTTKDIGQGTGLGLSTVYAIVRQSGGHIVVQSEPGAGSTFSVYLPRVDAAEPPGEAAAPAALPRGKEAVLLVEDDEAVRQLARQVLILLGYTVIEASNGRDGVALGSEPGRAVDLVLADVVLGDMSGPAVVAAIRAARPAVRVIYMSGYAEDAIVQTGALRERRSFLQKPFTPMNLARTIRDVLDHQPEGARS